MPAFTSFLNLYKPGGGSTGLITPDEVVDIDRINANMDLIDANAALWGSPSARNMQFTGLSGALGGVTGMKRGDTYQETDGGFFQWRYDGSNWITGKNGMWLIKPLSVAGTGVTEAGGKVSFGTTGNTVTVNGCFSPNFKRYKIFFDFSLTGAVTSPILYLANGGVPDSAANYHFQSLYGNGAAAVASQNAAYNFFSLSGGTASDFHGEVTVFNPFVSPVKFAKMQAWVGAINAGYSFTGISGAYLVAKSFDGFQLALAIPAGRTFNGGEITVFGIE